MTAKEKEDAINELTAYIHCLKCDRSGKVCDDNCPTQYEAGNCGEIIKNLEFLLEEVKKMPTLFKSAYNLLAYYEPLEPCEDCVSRQAVLDKAYAYGNGLEPVGYCVNVEDIQALPPIQPKVKVGHWIPTYGNVKCSVCGNVKDSRNVGKATHYCDFCGAKIESEDKK